jgi:hypothetical protein
MKFDLDFCSLSILDACADETERTILWLRSKYPLIRAQVARDFAVDVPPKQFEVVLLSGEELKRLSPANHARLRGASGPGGFWSSSRNTIFVLAHRQLPIEDILTHEMAHACLTSAQLACRLPYCIDEGYAYHLESLHSLRPVGARTDRRFLLSYRTMMLSRREPFTLAQLCAVTARSASILKGVSKTFFLAQSLLFVRFFVSSNFRGCRASPLATIADSCAQSGGTTIADLAAALRIQESDLTALYRAFSKRQVFTERA